jgi:hypothetical protein
MRVIDMKQTYKLYERIEPTGFRSIVIVIDCLWKRPVRANCRHETVQNVRPRNVT